MNAVVNQMNTFLRVFSTINRLFCEVRWLERNLRNSNSTVMLIVGGIIIFSLIIASDSQGILPPGFSVVLKEWGPFVIVGLVLVLFVYRRFVSGPMDGSGNLNEVMFGGSQQARNSRGTNSGSNNEESPPEAVPLYHSISSPVNPGMVHADAVKYAV